MSDSEKMDQILKMVGEIREYIGSRPDCPQHLWSEGRRAEEAYRQQALLGFGAYQQQSIATNSKGPWDALAWSVKNG